MELDHIGVVKNFLHLKKMNVTNCIRFKAQTLSEPCTTDCTAFASGHILVRVGQGRCTQCADDFSPPSSSVRKIAVPGTIK